jgi:hypothetical protein
MLLSDAFACTPEVNVRLPVGSFILANSSLRVISYKPLDAIPLSTFPSRRVTVPTSQLLSSSKSPARNMVWDTVAPIFPSTGLPLMSNCPFLRAFRHSQASSGLSSRNLRYCVTPAAVNSLSYHPPPPHSPTTPLPEWTCLREPPASSPLSNFPPTLLHREVNAAYGHHRFTHLCCLRTCEFCFVVFLTLSVNDYPILA